MHLACEALCTPLLVLAQHELEKIPADTRGELFAALLRHVEAHAATGATGATNPWPKVTAASGAQRMVLEFCFSVARQGSGAQFLGFKRRLTP